MTPTEKAKDLFDKMKGFRVKHTHSKKCAIICVAEIVESINSISYEEAIKDLKYWTEVIKELRLL